MDGREMWGSGHKALQDFASSNLRQGAWVPKDIRSGGGHCSGCGKWFTNFADDYWHMLHHPKDCLLRRAVKLVNDA